MGKPYSLDLRKRVVAAVLVGGMSRNQAAQHFGVGISTAINWVKRQQETGNVAPGKMGGHRPKTISGEHRLWVLQRTKGGDFTLRGLEKVLVPTLRQGDIVIMDNLGSHRGKAVRALIRTAGAKLFFLPKYSPDLNPIEQVFAKLKHFLRKAAARITETICAAIGEILGTFTPEEWANYFKNSGYRPT